MEKNRVPHLTCGQQNKGSHEDVGRSSVSATNRISSIASPTNLTSLTLTKGLAKNLEQKLTETLIKREIWDDSSFKRVIREMGLKVTEQRMAILKSLTAGRAHVTAQEVYEDLCCRHPDIGFATVYRFLRKMTELHLVTEVRMGGSPARYELTPRRHHDHLTCLQCRRIVEFENSQIEHLQEKVAREQGFTLTHHVLELYGHCPQCQKAAD